MPRRLGQALMVFGVVGFLSTFCLPMAGTWLSGVELPTFFETTTIALPDGGRLTATMPTQRVQRYDRDGRFQLGWFVAARGGHFAIGLTQDGKVAVCTGRGRDFQLYDFDGRLIEHHRPCLANGRPLPAILQPSELVLAGSPLQRVAVAPPPAPSLSAWLLVPYWHPFVAWIFGFAGAVMLKLSSSRAARQPG